MSEARRWGVTDVTMVCYRPGDRGVRDACRWRVTDVGTGVADLGVGVRDEMMDVRGVVMCGTDPGIGVSDTRADGVF